MAEHLPSTPAGFGCCQACKGGGTVGHGQDGAYGSLDVAEEEEEEEEEEEDKDDLELMQQTEESSVQDLTLGDWA